MLANFEQRDTSGAERVCDRPLPQPAQSSPLASGKRTDLCAAGNRHRLSRPSGIYTDHR